MRVLQENRGRASCCRPMGLVSLISSSSVSSMPAVVLTIPTHALDILC